MNLKTTDQFPSYPNYHIFWKKIFEKRFYKYIKKNRLLSDNQYCLREGYSTAMALTDLVDNIATAIDKEITHNIIIFRP